MVRGSMEAPTKSELITLKAALQRVRVDRNHLGAYVDGGKQLSPSVSLTFNSGLFPLVHRGPSWIP